MRLGVWVVAGGVWVWGRDLSGEGRTAANCGGKGGEESDIHLLLLL